jgi:sugar/nucleoside kinase (ribokinase family)
MSDYLTFTIIIDDIVFPDGRTAIGVLGGGGPQTAFGMRLWAERVGLVSGVGSDLPAPARHWLETMGLDLGGLRYSSEWPTARAWQLCEADGLRTQIWRVKGPAIGAQLGRSLERLPTGYPQAKAFHFGIHPEEPDLDFIAALRRPGVVVSLEPFRAAFRPLSDGELRALVSAGDIFSPNLREAESLVGAAEPLTMIRRLVQAGAKIVALRQGAAGATVHRADSGETWQIPAFATSLVDPTGAGNAFCGGFVAGWVETQDLRLAGLYGAVAASFMIEQVGLPPAERAWREAAQQRLATLAGQTIRLSS